MVDAMSEITSTAATGAYFEAMFKFGNERAAPDHCGRYSPN
jgi:hypothetical protein